jgi:hypothetical protein
MKVIMDIPKKYMTQKGKGFYIEILDPEMREACQNCDCGKEPNLSGECLDCENGFDLSTIVVKVKKT